MTRIGITEEEAISRDREAGWLRLDPYKGSQKKHMYQCPICEKKYPVQPIQVWYHKIKSCLECSPVIRRRAIRTENNTKICSSCGQTKSLNEFTKSKRGFDGLKCNCRDCCKNIALRYKYNLSLEEYNILMTKQKHCCPICGRSFNKIRADVDHCHTSGKVRSILCNNCNTALGHVFEDANIATNLTNYIIKHCN